MYQSIATSAETIIGILEDGNKALKAFDYLSKENEILVEESFYDSLLYYSECLDDNQEAALKVNTLQLFINPKVKKTKPDPVVNITKVSNKYLPLVSITLKSKDKILLTDDQKLPLLLEINNPELNINCCSSEHYLSPQKNDLVTNPRNINNILDGEDIDPHKVLFPYLINSKKITIYDPYPPVFRTKNGTVMATPIWIDLMDVCSGKKIKYVTISDQARKFKVGSNNYNNTSKDIENALRISSNNSNNLEIIFKDKPFHDRSIKTDYFDIFLGKGLAMFNKRNNLYTNSSGDGAFINITKI